MTDKLTLCDSDQNWVTGIVVIIISDCKLDLILSLCQVSHICARTVASRKHHFTGTSMQTVITKTAVLLTSTVPKSIRSIIKKCVSSNMYYIHPKYPAYLSFCNTMCNYYLKVHMKNYNTGDNCRKRFVLILVNLIKIAQSFFSTHFQRLH